MRKKYDCAVYILSNKTNTILYVGVCTGLERRIWEHKTKKYPGFSAQYNCQKLVYYESYKYIDDAIEREKQIKQWRRDKKEYLINFDNPTWDDLARDWYDDDGLKSELNFNVKNRSN